MTRSEAQTNNALHFAATSYAAERARLVQVLSAPKHRPHAAKVAALIAKPSLIARIVSLFV